MLVFNSKICILNMFISTFQSPSYPYVTSTGHQRKVPATPKRMHARTHASDQASHTQGVQKSDNAMDRKRKKQITEKTTKLNCSWKLKASDGAENKTSNPRKHTSCLYSDSRRFT